ncbi:hypothetical protein [Acetivibrio straminisolvens]|uniref:Uncharacterized protein n=1 Tax=Acetivibrio straminisolvens JCM 21531 TaxID=1294263 RepID=W4V276_9FIRM|nr:hypothetical protein [Acetivibrio straminisolvens]GAE87316.1 hypothetical protein JCM21531_671 [Acetivibrio straminisolvens JCM 21531]
MGLINFKKRDEIDELFEKLRSSSEEVREDAITKLENMQLGIEQGLKVLELAKNKFPPATYEWQDISARLIDICTDKPYVEYISKVESIYDELNPNAKISVLQFLATYKNEQAMIAYLKLLRKDYLNLKNLPFGNLLENPRFPQILFPGILKFTENNEIASQIYLLLLYYFNYDLVDEEVLSEYRSQIIQDILKMVDKVMNYTVKSSSFWDDDKYLELRSNAGVYFDLAGYIRDPKVTMALKRLMSVKDMRLKMFAAISLLKHGFEPAKEDVIDIAGNGEVRNWFFNSLVKMGRSEIYPEEYRNQKCFAESNMVDWLVYPTELGRVPDEIELMNIFDDEDMEYYLFRFRCCSSEYWQEKGWMAGVAGPFDKRNSPTTLAEGHTFSHFEKWESKRPEEHFESIVGNLKEYWMKLAQE